MTLPSRFAYHAAPSWQWRSCVRGAQGEEPRWLPVTEIMYVKKSHLLNAIFLVQQLKFL